MGKLVSKSLPYAWMGIVMTSLKDYSDKDENWPTHPLAQTI